MMQNNKQLYIAKVIFKNLLEKNKHLLYTYCIEAANYKEAYQLALIAASEKYFHLNNIGAFNYVGLQELTPLLEVFIPKEHQEHLHTIANIDEVALKHYQDELAQNLSVA